MKKIFLVLGASSDLGIGLIRKIIADNHDMNFTIVAHYNNNSLEIEKLIESNNNIDIRMIKADLADLNSTKKLIDNLDKWNISPTHIVNLCANQFNYTRLAEWNYEIVNRDMNIQVYSFAEILKKYVPIMAKNGYGKIVAMLTSYTIGTPPKNMSGYVTVKYALLGLIKSIASDYGDQGININGISPAMINTKFINNVGRKIKEITAETNPKHRNLEVNDVIPGICYLLSDDSEFISGTNLNLSGKTD